MNLDFAQRAINLSKVSSNVEEIPVGAVVVKNGKVIGTGINSRVLGNNITGHAEINAILEASMITHDWRLDDCEMYVTLHPCIMCTGAILDSRIKKVYYLFDRTNVCFDKPKEISFIKINNSELCTEYQQIMGLFFENKRK